MAGQSIFCRAFSLFSNSSKVILTNRINHVNLTPTCKGLRQEPEKHWIPEKPKRPLTAFFSFLTDKRPVMLKANPALSSREIVKRLSDEWKSLSTAAKERYEEQAKQNKIAYDKKILVYVENLTPEQENLLKGMEKEKREEKVQRKLKKELREVNRPKKPASSFGIFVRALNNEKGSRGERNVSEFMAEIKDRWAKMSDAEKNKYKLEYDKNKAQYEKEMTTWEAKMIALGKDHLVRTKTLHELQLKSKGTKKPHKKE